MDKDIRIIRLAHSLRSYLLQQVLGNRRISKRKALAIWARVNALEAVCWRRGCH